MASLGDSLKFHHVGVITPTLAESVRFYTELGYLASEVFRDPLQSIEIVLLQRPDGPVIELVSPTDPSSPAAVWKKRIRSGPYHTCYETSRLEEVIEDLRGKGMEVVLGPIPAAAFGGKRVAFLWGEPAGLFELLELV